MFQFAMQFGLGMFYSSPGKRNRQNVCRCVNDKIPGSEVLVRAYAYKERARNGSCAQPPHCHRHCQSFHLTAICGGTIHVTESKIDEVSGVNYLSKQTNQNDFNFVNIIKQKHVY